MAILWRGKSLFWVLAGLATALLLFLTFLARETPEESFLVGAIYVVGNEATPDWVIRGQIRLHPGQMASVKDLQRAVSNLERLQLFEVNPATGLRPTVLLLKEETNLFEQVARPMVSFVSKLQGEKKQAYVDILVQVKEKEWNWLLFACWDLTMGCLTYDLEQLNSCTFPIYNRFSLWETGFLGVVTNSVETFCDRPISDLVKQFTPAR